MTSSIDKIRPLAEAIGHIRDGDVVAIGGHVARRPMALLREIVRQGRKRLHVVGLDGGIAIDMLIGAGCVATVEIPHAGSGHHIRRMVEKGDVRVVEHSEAVALDRFRAAALGLPLLPGKSGAETGPHMRPFTDPFTGESWMAVEAIRPDVALIHAHAADRQGTIQLDAGPRHDAVPDAMIARSARTVIVSVEQVVSEQAVTNRSTDIILPGRDVTCVVEVPYGAHPCGCDNRYGEDSDHLGHYRRVSETPEGFAGYLDAHVRGPADHWAYLDAIGMRRLMAVSTRRTHRP